MLGSALPSNPKPKDVERAVDSLLKDYRGILILEVNERLKARRY